HTRFSRDWSSDVCSSDLVTARGAREQRVTVAQDDGNDRHGQVVEELGVESLANHVSTVDVDVASLGERASFGHELRDRALDGADRGNLWRERAPGRDEDGAVFVGPARKRGDDVVGAPPHEQRPDAREELTVAVVVAPLDR